MGKALLILGLYLVVHARESASFWRENVTTVVILIYSENVVHGRSSENKLSNVGSFIILLSGEGLITSVSINNRANIFGEKKIKESNDNEQAKCENSLYKRQAEIQAFFLPCWYSKSDNTSMSA